MDSRKPRCYWSDQQMETVVAHLLRAGVLLAFAVVLLGGGIFLLRHGGDAPHYQAFHGEPSDLRSVGGIVQNAFSLERPWPGATGVAAVGGHARDARRRFVACLLLPTRLDLHRGDDHRIGSPAVRPAGRTTIGVGGRGPGGGGRNATAGRGFMDLETLNLSVSPFFRYPLSA